MQSPYPPYIYLCQCADHAPYALTTYLMLWRDFLDSRPDEKGILYTREMIEEARYLRWTRFVNDLRSLGFEGFLEYQKHESGEMVRVILALEPMENWDIC